MNEDDHNSAEENTPADNESTQPIKKLNRLLSASAEENGSIVASGTGAHSLNPQTDPENQSEDAEGTENSVTQTQRHPTGDPTETGGWFGEDLGATLPPIDDPDATRILTHTESAALNRPDPDQTRANQSSPATPPPPYGGGDNSILPQRVEEVDPEATRVSPSAFAAQSQNRGTVASRHVSAYQQQSGSQPASGQTQAVQRQSSANAPTRAFVPQTAPSQRPPAAPPPPASGNGKKAAAGGKKPLGCFVRGLIISVFLVVILALAAGSFLVIRYFAIAASLPSVDDLRSNASQFETTRILDRNGNLIYEIIDPNAGRRTYVTLDKISPYLIAATIATEDKDFYTHPGFDPVAIARAMWQNYTSGGIVSGASTITQQLARALLLGPEEQYERTVERKAREIVLAAEITRKYSKEEILELYLNEFYYGNLAYGVEAAAETYFNTTADKLTFGQAAFLAGIPQSPNQYDIFTDRDATLNRFRTVVVLSFDLSTERNCIEVSTELRPVCIDQQTAVDAVREIENYDFQPDLGEYRYPHWIEFIRNQLESMYDPATIYKSGFTVYTTLDPGLQDQAEQMVRDQLAQMTDNNATDGALVAIKPTTGEILAMVGSADFYNDAISGQVNMATSPRQPGSAIKPLTYTAAFEKGWTPSTLIWDIPSKFPPSGLATDTSTPYEPVNYDGKFHGPVTVRTALANSFNIPAVKALQFVGVYDDPATTEADGFVNFAKRMGITTLTSDTYGLALTLGGGDVSLLELTGAYSIFATGGRKIDPVAITRIDDYEGNTVYQYEAPAGEQVIRSEHAYLISSILSDNQARAPMFGENSILNVGFPAAVKTGTTNDYRDNWTVGYTPDLAVGVWVGNADYTPMVNTTGVSGAAPIWASFMKVAIQQQTGGNPSAFARPSGIVDRIICTTSGTEPSEWCPEQRSEVFAYDQLPQPKEDDLWKKVNIDTWTGLLASSACPDFADDKFALNITDEDAKKWILETSDGQNWAKNIGFEQPIFFTPDRECSAEDQRPLLLFAGLSEDQTITASPVQIYALIKVSGNYKDYRLEYGLGRDPGEWKEIFKGGPQSDQPQFLLDWDVSSLPAGDVTLRLTLNSDHDTYARRTLHLKLQVPTATPTPTASPTITPTITLTPTVTQTNPPPTATATPSFTASPEPSQTPTP